MDVTYIVLESNVSTLFGYVETNVPISELSDGRFKDVNCSINVIPVE